MSFWVVSAENSTPRAGVTAQITALDVLPHAAPAARSCPDYRRPGAIQRDGRRSGFAPTIGPLDSQTHPHSTCGVQSRPFTLADAATAEPGRMPVGAASRPYTGAMTSESARAAARGHRARAHPPRGIGGDLRGRRRGRPRRDLRADRRVHRPGPAARRHHRCVRPAAPRSARGSSPPPRRAPATGARGTTPARSGGDRCRRGSSRSTRSRS